MPLHDDELHLPDDVVRRLIAEQFPEWSEFRIQRVAVAGTVNRIYRIGSELTARFPLRGRPEATERLLVHEAAAHSELAAVSPFPTPLPVAQGEPGLGYPLPWSVQTWIPGTVATPDGLAASTTFASDLVVLLRAFRSAETRGRRFAGEGRGGDLRDSDTWMETCFRESAGLLPVERLRSLWDRFRELPSAGPDVMTHGDLIPSNLLVDGEHLAGVLDGGGFGPADPALDLVAVWHHFDAEARAQVRADLGCGDVEWQRGAAWAFQQAMGLVWYYRESHPVMSALGRSTLSRILDDRSPENVE